MGVFACPDACMQNAHYESCMHTRTSGVASVGFWHSICLSGVPSAQSAVSMALSRRGAASSTNAAAASRRKDFLQMGNDCVCDSMSL